MEHRVFIQARSLQLLRGRSTAAAMASGPSSSEHRHAEEATTRPTYNPSTGFNTNIVIITAAILLVLVCALGMNSLVKRLLRCWERRRLFGRARRGAAMAEEFAGQGPKGMKKKELCSLPTLIYRAPPAKKNASSGGDEKGGGGREGAAAARAESGEGSSTCPICLNEFADGERLRPMPACQHLFHAGCVDTWLAKSSSCPTCRGAIAASGGGGAAPAQQPRDAKPSRQVQLQIVITTTTSSGSSGPTTTTSTTTLAPAILSPAHPISISIPASPPPPHA